jgi:hypothetical protein
VAPQLWRVSGVANSLRSEIEIEPEIDISSE